MIGVVYHFLPIPVDFFGAETTSLDGDFLSLAGVVTMVLEWVLRTDLVDLWGAGMMWKDAERKLAVGKSTRQVKSTEWFG